MTVEVALLVSVTSLFFSIYFNIRNSKRSDSSEIEQKARETAIINVKLDNIGNDVRDIKHDISAVKDDVKNLTERVVVVEQSTKSAHHRLDTLMEERNA